VLPWIGARQCGGNTVRAIDLWFDYPEQFPELALNEMNYDYSWNRSGADYVNIYNHIRTNKASVTPMNSYAVSEQVKHLLFE
jgi:glycogen synthase